MSGDTGWGPRPADAFRWLSSLDGRKRLQDCSRISTRSRARASSSPPTGSGATTRTWQSVPIARKRCSGISCSWSATGAWGRARAWMRAWALQRASGPASRGLAAGREAVLVAAGAVDFAAGALEAAATRAFSFFAVFVSLAW